MKRFGILITALFLLLLSVGGIPIQAQTTSPTDNHTAREEAEGKVIWEKLQAKQLECKNLTDDNFEVLGEYFMGQITANSCCVCCIITSGYSTYLKISPVVAKDWRMLLKNLRKNIKNSWVVLIYKFCYTLDLNE